MHTFLKVINQNWGLTKAGDWLHTEFVLNQSGSLHIKVYFLHPVIDTSVVVSAEDMSIIQGNLEKIITNPPDSVPRVLGGEAWSFRAYNDTGELIFNWSLSQICGLESLENIGRILNSYIPEYEKPEYKEEEIEGYALQYVKEC